jgi:uncharacterized membrane protein HdeD (DUF308 family)
VVVAGLFEIEFAFRRGALASNRAMWILSGLATLAFGVVLALRPDAGVVTLTTLFGFYAIVYGISAIAIAAHRTSRTRSDEDQNHNRDERDPQRT